MREHPFHRPATPAISDKAWAKVVAVVGDPTRRFVMPHELGNEAMIDYAAARAVLLALGAQGDVALHTLVYHLCSPAPVAMLQGAHQKVTLPWRCPDCEEDEEDPEAISYDLAVQRRPAEGAKRARRPRLPRSRIFVTPLVWIKVVDRPNGDLVRRLLHWLGEDEDRPRPLKTTGSRTGFARGSKKINVYRGGFAPDAAERVIDWLDRHR